MAASVLTKEPDARDRGRRRSTHGLEACGITQASHVYWNLTTPELYEEVARRGDGVISAHGALIVDTGEHTGRAAKDKAIVREPSSEEKVFWGDVNKEFPQEKFNALRDRMMKYAAGRDLFVQDTYAGADPRYRLPVRVVTELAWHSLFARTMFINDDEGREKHTPEFTVVNIPSFKADPAVDGTRSETFILMDFRQRLVLIGGTRYAGETKKSVFTILNYLLPQRGVMSMHCSANVGQSGDVAIFFGLSGTGKTTLSADPERRLIGDDEHGWSDDGVFNFEGGCYAKTINLSKEKEFQIFNAIRFGCVLENVTVDRQSRMVDYEDHSITENTRAAYPLEYIENSVPEGTAGHPEAVLFLTADAFGVLPPISALTPEQAAYYFLSGYTAKLAGTEADMENEVEATFSTCFGAPFLPLPPTTYSTMLTERMREHNARCYLINTGWSGGPYGVGSRIDIAETRAMVRAAIAGKLDGIETWEHPVFGLRVPKEVPGVPSHVLDPRGTWDDKEAYDERAKELASLFADNFKKFEDEVDEEVLKAGPKV